MKGGQYGRWILVKSNDEYYRASGEIENVQLSDIQYLSRARTISGQEIGKGIRQH